MLPGPARYKLKCEFKKYYSWSGRILTGEKEKDLALVFTSSDKRLRTSANTLEFIYEEFSEKELKELIQEVNIAPIVAHMKYIHHLHDQYCRGRISKERFEREIRWRCEAMESK